MEGQQAYREKLKRGGLRIIGEDEGESILAVHLHAQWSGLNWKDVVF